MPCFEVSRTWDLVVLPTSWNPSPLGTRFLAPLNLGFSTHLDLVRTQVPDPRNQVGTLSLDSQER